ncbi:uncharacterized protein LOC105380509 [Plutella xylostella]|uniref:uncharacterized protein LOC105380509 n=1 Tax=Plutella xylostella TaxID=51655 RepID=UPI002032DE20|nr:uncharacterized protein LOC105380509 [Plutella xylostella]
MRCHQVLQIVLLLLSEAIAFRIYNPRRVYMPTLEMNCYEMPMKVTMVPARTKSEAWRLQKKLKVSAALPPGGAGVSTSPTPLNALEIQKRFDHLFTETDDIVKEHAKLVQDINSLRQVVFVAPLADETKDYDESVYHEIIETTSTTTARPTPRSSPSTTPPTKWSKPGGIPVLLLGGASQRLSVKSASAPRPTISLVGTSASPLAKHPYPFVGPGAAKPYRVCMPTSLPVTYAAPTRRPSLWSRLLSFFPRLTG